MKKLIVAAVLVVVLATAVLSLWTAVQFVNYKTSNDAWKGEATQMVNVDTQNLQTIAQYLEANPIKNASGT